MNENRDQRKQRRQKKDEPDQHHYLKEINGMPEVSIGALSRQGRPLASVDTHSPMLPYGGIAK